MLGKGNMSCCQMIPFPSHEGVKVRAVLTSRVNTFGSWLFKINVSVIMECPIYSLGVLCGAHIISQDLAVIIVILLLWAGNVELTQVQKQLRA